MARAMVRVRMIGESVMSGAPANIVFVLISITLTHQHPQPLQPVPSDKPSSYQTAHRRQSQDAMSASQRQHDPIQDVRESVRRVNPT